MVFETLINKPTSELELLNHLVAKIQLHYLEFQEKCFFLKLDKHGEKFSQIIWIRTFKDIFDLGDFLYDSVMQRACIAIKFHNDHYEILCHGYYYCNKFEVWPDKVSEGRPIELSGDTETRRMVPRELLEKGFGEISSALSTSKGNKAV